MQKRLIDANKLIELCNIMSDKCDGIGESIWHQFATTVEWCPTVDAVEVVRCEDCKYHSYWCEEHETRVPLDAYCWCGEREEKAEPVRHGHWKEDGAMIKDQCSVCGLSVNWSQYKTPYCPFCGAKMDEERK